MGQVCQVFMYLVGWGFFLKKVLVQSRKNYLVFKTDNPIKTDNMLDF